MYKETQKDIYDLFFMTNIFKNKDDSMIYFAILFVKLMVMSIQSEEVQKNEEDIEYFNKTYVENETFYARLDEMTEFYK